jgi:hypothetical protein
VLEVNGIIYGDSLIYAPTCICVGWGTSAGYFSWNSSSGNYSKIYGSTTTDELNFGLGSQHGRQLCITTDTNVAKDHDHTIPDNPTVFVHSSTDPDVNNTQWGSFDHDTVNFRCRTGAGCFEIPANPTPPVLGTNSSVAFSLDESGKLVATAKYSNGVVVSGTVTLS